MSNCFGQYHWAPISYSKDKYIGWPVCNTIKYKWMARFKRKSQYFLHKVLRNLHTWHSVSCWFKTRRRSQNSVGVSVMFQWVYSMRECIQWPFWHWIQSTYFGGYSPLKGSKHYRILLANELDVIYCKKGMVLELNL